MAGPIKRTLKRKQFAKILNGQLLMCAVDDEIKKKENKLRIHDDI